MGATGFVGRNLVNALVAKNIRTIALVRKTTDLKCETLQLGKAPNTPLPTDTVFFNMAAHRYDASAFRAGQHDLLKYNTQIAMTAYEFCLANNIKEMRAASSIAVYGESEKLLRDDEPIDMNEWPHDSEAMYGWSKRFGEIAAELHRNKYGINTISFRLSNPYGPLDETDDTKAHVIPAFIIRALTTQGDFSIRGNPAAARDFIYVADAVDVMLQSLSKREETTAYNLGSGVNTRIDELAKLVLARCDGGGRQVVAAGKGSSDVVERKLDISRLKADFDITKFTPLEKGLDQTVEWYRHVIN